MAEERIDIKRIKEARQEKGLSILDVSEALGYQSYVAYYRKEEGQRRFTTTDIAKLSKLLDLDLDEIFFRIKVTEMVI